MDSDEVLLTRMRAAVTGLVKSRAGRLRTMTPQALVGALSASALTPVIVASGHPGAVLAAGAGVAGSLGASVLGGVVMDAVARLRPAEATEGEREPSPERVEQAVADRIEAAFATQDLDDRDLRGEVIALFEAADVAGTALQAAGEVEGEDLVPALVGAFTELSVLFGEFAFVLVTVRLSLEGMHQELRREVARQSVDRERARHAEADIRRIMDMVRDLAPAGGPGVVAGGGGARPRWDGCPYLGLLPFEQSHSTVFFGRRAATSRLLGRLAERLAGGGLLLVLGPSGAGKSSLLRAGLMAALADDRLVPGCRSWPRRVITPIGDPVRQLAVHLADLAGIDAISTEESLASHPDRAHLLAGQALAAHPLLDTTTGGGGEPARLVLVVDQLEELFTLTDDPVAQATFVAALAAMASNPVLPDGRPAAVVVAGIRGDFLDQAAAFAPLRDAVEAGPFTVGAMSESELKEVITGPAAEASVPVGDGLAGVILEDLRDRHVPVGFDSGVLPLLSQVLFVMWQADPAHPLTVDNYRRTGGVATIVNTSAERVYDTLTDSQRHVARRVFMHLADADDGTLTRRPATRAALRTAAGCDEAELDTVLEAFTAQRLVTRSDNDVVEIAHEQLLHSWGRLRDWLQPSATDQALHRALVDDAHAWRDHHRDPSYLYRGGQLLAVRQAADRWSADPARHLVVDQVAAEFLTVSHRRDRRRRRVTRTVVTSIVMLLVLTTGTTLVAINNAGRADQNAARADQQHALALSRQLAAQSRATRTVNWAASQRLAAAALHVAPTDEAIEAVSASLIDYRHLLGHIRPVDSVVFSSDGDRLAIASVNGVGLWDPATGSPVGGSMTGYLGGADPDEVDSGAVESAVFSPDGDRLATTGTHGVRLWNPATGTPIGEPLTGHSMVFSPDGDLLATASGNEVRLRDPATGTPIGEPLTGHTGSVRSVVFSPDGDRLATTGLYDETVLLWDPATGAPVGEPLTGHTHSVYSVVFSPDGDLLATASQDQTVRLWDPATGAPIGEPLTGHTGPVNSVVFSPDGDRLATAGGDEVQLWDPATRTPIGEPLLTGYIGPRASVVFSPDGDLLATASIREVRLWDPVTGTPVGAPLTGHTRSVVSVVFSPDGDLLATGSDDETVRLWDPATGTPVGEPLRGHAGSVVSVVFSPDGDLLAAASINGVLWDPVTGTPVGEPLRGHTGGMDSVAFSPDGDLLAVGDDATVQLWDPVTGTLVGEPLTGHTGAVNSVAFSPDGDLLAAASISDVRLWNAVTGTLVGEPLTGHTGAVNSVAFSPDGDLLATAGQDQTVRLWDPVGGTPVGAPLTGHTGPVNSVAFSPDGDLLATAGQDQTVRLWDPVGGTPVGAPLTGHTGPVNSVAFSPDGDLLATASGDGTVRLWNPALYTDPIQSLCEKAGSLTPDQWSTYAAGEPTLEVCS